MDFMSFLAKLQETATRKDIAEGLDDAEEEFEEEETYTEDDKDWPFNQFSQDFKVLGCSSVDTVHISDLTPLSFYRDYVACNKPVIIDGAIDHWPAMRKWTNKYLSRVAGDQDVTIDFTPDGRGDAIVMDKYFVTPVEEKMKFADFLQLIQREKRDESMCNEDDDDDGSSEEQTFLEDIIDEEHPHLAENIIPIPERLEKYTGVPYCQHQNSSFTTEFQFLKSDAGAELELASEAFGSVPDAINFWMGDTRAVSSMHSDPYENIYCVVAGEKRFTLCPPSDYYWLTSKSLPKAHWERISASQSNSTETDDSTTFSEDQPEDAANPRESDESSKSADSAKSDETDELVIGDFKAVVEPKVDNVEWIDVDVDYPSHSQKNDPLFKHITKFNVSVTKGQVLYLPALWYHGVRQKGRTIAVNFWYDMAYDVRWVNQEFMRNVATKMKKNRKSMDNSDNKPSDVPETTKTVPETTIDSITNE